MIEIRCCSAPRKIPESAIGKRFRCPRCARILQIVSAEPLADGGGAGDFDAGFTVISGPQLAGAHMFLGGVADVCIGKLPDSHLHLPGNLVSRLHCRLQRVDFGPSRWKIVDNHSTNGLFVNQSRVSEHELADGDVVTVGDYELRFDHSEEVAYLAAPVPAELAEAPIAPSGALELRPAPRATSFKPAPDASVAGAAGGGSACPSCDRPLARAAKICTDCGIHLSSGRPVLTHQDVDENVLYDTAEKLIWWISLFVWITPLPIPIRSQAFGTRKPYAIWTIAAATVLASITFYIAQNFSGSSEIDAPGRELMLWAPQGTEASATSFDPERLREMVHKMSQDDLHNMHELADDPKGELSDEEAVGRALARYERRTAGEFHWYQLITHAFLHDTSSIYNFAMHLAGNMVFLLVFGTRVNALIGNIATAILYPVLAVCAAAAHLASIGGSPSGPMLGASGAIMGLAGTYLILFPAHQVFCAMWISVWMYFRRYYGCKIFPLRGFWVLLIYFAYDLLMSCVSSHFGVGGGVAHMAHIGGFLTGVVLALAILFSRQYNTHGGDVLSVTLGRHAWSLIGKPSRWSKQVATA